MSPARLLNVELGDVICFTGVDEAFTVRAAVRLPHPVCADIGFVVCGEFAGVLTIPAARNGRAGVYLPVPPTSLRGVACRRAAAGATRYLAPHLPAKSGACPTVTWAADEAVTRPDPLVIRIWVDGNDERVFVRVDEVDLDTIDVTWMAARGRERAVAHHSGVVRVQARTPERAGSRTLVRPVPQPV